MSDPSKQQAPTLIPPHVLVEKTATVVLEFSRELPKTAFITLAFHDALSGDSLGSVPTAKLGPATLKANFPSFSRPGKVKISVQFTREERPSFPPFIFPVLSPLEAILKGLRPETESSSSLPLTASLLAYMAHSERGGEGRGDHDGVLCDLLHSTNPAELSDWRLGPLLSGSHEWDDNLLHFCIRRGLGDAAMLLLQPRYIAGKADYVVQRASQDGKTPLELAQKHGMTNVANMAENLAAQVGKASSTPKGRHKKKVPRSSSIDSSLHLAADYEYVEDNQVPTVTTPKKKEKGGKKLRWPFRGEGKEKEASKASQIQQLASTHRPTSAVSAASATSTATSTATHDDSDSPITYSDSGSISSQVLSPIPPVPNPPGPAYATAGTGATPILESQYDLLLSHRDQMPLPPPNEHPSTNGPSTFEGSSTHMARDFDHPALPPWSPDIPSPADRGIRQPPHSGEPVAADSVKSVPRDSVALSAAVTDLLKRSIFVAAVTTEHHWPGEEFSVKFGDKVHVIEEMDDGFMGVCRKRYKKFPKHILRILNSTEVQDLRGGESDDDDDVEIRYREPRNVPRVEESLSDEEDHYRVPRNVPRAEEADSDDEGIYNVPRSTISRGDTYTVSDDEGGLYKVPTNIPRVDDSNSDEDDHDYEPPPDEAFMEMLQKRNEGRQNNSLLQTHEPYKSIPSRQTLEKDDTPGRTAASSCPVTTGGMSSLDTLMAIAGRNKEEPKANMAGEEDEDVDIYDYPPTSPKLSQEDGGEDGGEHSDEGKGNIYDIPSLTTDSTAASSAKELPPRLPPPVPSHTLSDSPEDCREKESKIPPPIPMSAIHPGLDSLEGHVNGKEIPSSSTELVNSTDKEGGVVKRGGGGRGEEEEENIYDYPTESAVLGDVREILRLQGHGTNVYDKLVNNLNGSSASGNAPHAPATSNGSSNWRGESAALGEAGAKASYSPRVSEKRPHLNGPTGKTVGQSSPHTPPGESYGNAGPTAELDRNREGSGKGGGERGGGGDAGTRTSVQVAKSSLARQKKVDHRTRPHPRDSGGSSGGSHQITSPPPPLPAKETTEGGVGSTEVVSVYGKVTSAPKDKPPPLTAPKESRSAFSHLPGAGEGKYSVLMPSGSAKSPDSDDNSDAFLYDTLHEVTSADQSRVMPLRYPPSSPSSQHPAARKPRSVSSPDHHHQVVASSRRAYIPPRTPPAARPAQPPSPKPKPKVSHKPPVRKPSLEEPNNTHSIPNRRAKMPLPPSPTPVPKPRRHVTASVTEPPESRVKSLDRKSVCVADIREGERKAHSLDRIREVDSQRVEPHSVKPHLPPSPGSKRKPVAAPKPNSPDGNRRRQHPASPDLPPKSPGPGVKPKPHPPTAPRQRAVTSHGTGVPTATAAHSPPLPTRPRNYSAMAADSPPLPPKPTAPTRKPAFAQP